MDLLLTEDIDYRRWLLTQLNQRRQKTPSYSLRSFSKKIGISPASLSQLISGKRPLSKKMAEQVASRLCLSPAETHRLVQSAILEKFQSLSNPEATSSVPCRKDSQIEMDIFRTISDWYHYAILSLVQLPEAKSDPSWFSTRLGITLLEARQAIQRLERLGFIVKEGRKLRRSTPSLSTPDGVTDSAIRKYHFQMLNKAEEALERDPVSERDFGAITLAIDPSRIPEARKLISKFRKQMATVLAGGEKKRVYTFSTQLFGLDRKR